MGAKTVRWKVDNEQGFMQHDEIPLAKGKSILKMMR